MKKKKVFVGMSGGVDSSVSAFLLKEAGYDVTGVYIKTWQPDWLPCTWREERRDAMRVAAVLDIPFLTIDCEKEYKEKVADYFIQEYRAGRTPNPDIMCNKEVKFGSFLRQALAHGADMIATGHYAQNIDSRLYEGADKEKDQSYFLWTLTNDQLSKVLFPVGHLQKSDVRALARKHHLPTAEKKDSQGICFLGDIDMKEFLKHYIQEKEGIVLDPEGKVIGTHPGAWFFTIGERRGFSITHTSDHDGPYYVIAKDVEKNTITVSEREPGKVSPYATKKVVLTDVVIRTDENLAGGLDRNFDFGDRGNSLTVRVRYRQPHQPCTIKKEKNSKNGSHGSRVVTFAIPQEGVSIGQSVVLYRGTECLGGGVIASTLR